MPNALELLRQDHTKVKELFTAFEQTDDEATKKGLARSGQEFVVAGRSEALIYAPSRSEERRVGKEC